MVMATQTIVVTPTLGSRISKPMCDNSEFGNYNYADFVEHFYSHALVDNDCIKDALDDAMREMTGNQQNFGDSVLYNGYYLTVFGESWFSRMRVFGDGNLLLGSS